jgi:transposase InsO family protein
MDARGQLVAIRQRRFVITTDSQHELEVYLNLAKRMKLTAANQLWIADLTYIRLHSECVYLAVILDAWSRWVVGWALDRTLAARLAVAALERAIAARQPQPGVVHHSDRGIQYASHDYVSLLDKHHMTPSMSRPANPYDNAICERGAGSGPSNPASAGFGFQLHERLFEHGIRGRSVLVCARRPRSFRIDASARRSHRTGPRLLGVRTSTTRHNR